MNNFSKEKAQNSAARLIRDISKLSGKIGILGGSFDPVHLDHIGLAASVKKSLGLDYIIFLPTPHNPFKDSSLFTTEDRIEMLLSAIEGHEDFYVSDLEIAEAEKQKKDTVRTIETLELLDLTKNPKSEFFFIIGADSLISFHKWERFHEILNKVKVIPVQRGSKKEEIIAALIKQGQMSEHEINGLSNNWVNYETVNFGGEPISSTEIKKSLEKGHVPVDFLPPGVTKYLSDNF